MLTGTEDLEKEQKRLAEQMNVDADAVQEAIAENARVAQNQEEYSIRYEALSARFQETKDKYDAVTAEIAQRGIRRREFGRFHPLAGIPAGDGDGVQRGALGQSGGSCDGAQQRQHRLHPHQRDGDQSIRQTGITALHLRVGRLFFSGKTEGFVIE